MFDDKGKKNRSYSIYTDISRMKRRNGSIDFISSGYVPRRDLYHMPIIPKKDKNNEIQKNFLMRDIVICMRMLHIFYFL